MTNEHARWRRLVAFACAAALLGGVAPAAAALPFAPPGPSDDDVRSARDAVADAQSSVASMEVRLAQLGVELDDAWVAVERAAEDYTESVVARDAALADARTTARQLEEAEAELGVARSRLVSIALKAMRSGSANDQLRAVLEAGGIEDLVDKSEALTLLGSRTNEVVQNFRAATLVAETLRARAAAALAAHEAAAVDAEAALATAHDVQ
ncbi:MAG: glycoside hydrolase, partial [Actinomycetota bacterium]|nr:glycoside hydrolase [Actinomycetota bacterium]